MQSEPSMPSMGGRSGREPLAITADLKLTSSPPSTASVFGPVKTPRPLTTLMPRPFIRPARPLTVPSTIVRRLDCTASKSSARPSTRTPSVREAVVRLVPGVGGLHHRLGRDAADVEAGAADGACFHADHAGAELGGANRRRIAARARAQYDEVAIHFR